jgi:uncharacterized protein YrrD
MLLNLNKLKGYVVVATDGHIGHVKDFYFDDASWEIRYLIVETGSWLASRKVLISPISIERANAREKTFAVNISKEQVRHSPHVDTDKPMSRQHERDHRNYYGLPTSIAITGIFSVAPQAADGIQSVDMFDDVEEVLHRDDDPHLRSCNVVIGYHVEASDGDIGHVDGMLVDDETWAVRYLIVNTSNWWLGHAVLIAPQWIKGISWSAATLSVDLTREAVKDAPPYDPTGSDKLTRSL